MTKKSVFSVEVNDAKSKKAAMKAISRFQDVESYSIDMEKKTLTVLGDIDPVEVVRKLRKLFRADIETVGQNEVKGDNKKKEEANNDKSKQQEEMEKIIRAHFNAHYPYYYCYPRYISVEEDPRTCVIC